MALTLHTIAPKRGSRTKKFRVGRGYATGRGTTAGRGTKGQRARTGGRKRLKLKGLKQMLLAFPKSRGFTSKFAEVYDLPLKRVLPKFKDGDRIGLEDLKKHHLIPKSAVEAKIIGNGEADKKLNFIGIKATAGAKAAIEKAGGSFGAEKKRKPIKKSVKQVKSVK
jgi:large subunit ribosomal protein L15